MILPQKTFLKTSKIKNLRSEFLYQKTCSPAHKIGKKAHFGFRNRFEMSSLRTSEMHISSQDTSVFGVQNSVFDIKNIEYRTPNIEVKTDLKQKSPASGLDTRLICYFKLAPTYSPWASTQVPSAQMGLTALFGMGRGGTPSL